MKTIGLSDVISVALIILGILGYFVEISKIKVKPLSALGRLFNSDLIRRMNSLESTVSTVKDQIDEVAAKTEEAEVKAARMRIQRFADEMYGDIRHSREHFELILMDITQYNNYCDTHPGFINEKTRIAQNVITRKYEECMEERSFRGEA